ncbi:hypothetical protein KIH39_12480 [Telmatocola sphagniphila]|uniref:Uncharacterized protein n=1 Tax=Telmatocola sphagniphila TaxID=1123043 RepID=A0A8E6BD27_9BACT|nr:hypothetical protein [Telmatocola sphagniphila]QVL34685.1 hypothetical protein KIH39_12480 [Telmatocola sphagniphila]
MNAYTVDKPTRVCAITGRRLEVGERIHSALIEENARLCRRDYALNAWIGAPEGTIAHWVCRLQDAEAKKIVLDDEMLLECFERLADTAEPQRQNFLFVLALLLMRRKKLVLDESGETANAEVMHLLNRRTKRRFRVVDPQMSEEEMQAVQDELFRLFEGG